MNREIYQIIVLSDGFNQLQVFKNKEFIPIAFKRQIQNVWAEMVYAFPSNFTALQTPIRFSTVNDLNEWLINFK